MSEWMPEKNKDKWLVRHINSITLETAYALGKDGMPLHFWNEKSAQIKADSLNKKSIVP